MDVMNFLLVHRTCITDQSIYNLDASNAQADPAGTGCFGRIRIRFLSGFRIRFKKFGQIWSENERFELERLGQSSKKEDVVAANKLINSVLHAHEKRERLRQKMVT